MKIKRFFAADMREALRQVKEELGADAVILSNNKVSDGIELVAAIDYDEDAIKRQAADSRNPSAMHRSAGTPASGQTLTRPEKRSVFARVRKPSIAEKLEDDIKDDVIQFSHSSSSVTGGSADKGIQDADQDFGALLKQTAVARESTNAFTRPSVNDRKQPYISDLDNTESASQNISQNAVDDYQHLNSRTTSRSQGRFGGSKAIENDEWDLDDFFSDSGSIRKSNAQAKKKSAKTRSGSKPATGKVEWLQDPALTSVQEEIKSLRGILENQLSGLAWGDFARRHPHRAELLSRLYRLGMKSSISEKLVKQLDADDALETSWRRLLTLIARNIPTTEQDLIDEGGVIALVGPTGVGKTTNIAKLAARFTLKHGAKELALVTTDSYRIGAHEQLKTYGRILGAPVYVADDEQDLKQILSRLEDKKLVLIDTAGMSHRDIRLAQQLTMLRRSYSSIKVLAVLSAASQTMAMDEVIKTFNARELDGCIASKVDESTSIGGIISILIENQLQLNYISDGQKVPEDIHHANTKDFLKQALEMVRQHPVQVKTDELAMSFSAGGLSHAFG